MGSFGAVYICLRRNLARVLVFRLLLHISPQRGLSVCVSVVCHTCAPCLNRSTHLDAVWPVCLCGPMTHCARCGSLTPQEKGRFGGGQTPAKTCIANCCCHLANINQRFRLSPNHFGPWSNQGRIQQIDWKGSCRVKGAYPMSRARGDNHVRIS